MNSKQIPDIIVSRLPHYLRTLQQMYAQDLKTTSSLDLGQRLGISAAQIRKDLSQFGEFGKQGTGYSIPFLINQLQNILNVNREWEMVLVGAGDLGHAIARYQGFRNCGFIIKMVFDNDPQKIGTQIAGLIVQSINDLKPHLQGTEIKIGLITVPASEAQTVADQLVDSGIESILNYSPTSLIVPDGVRVQYIDPVLHLQRMTYYLG